jgi:exopolyphosphatase/guanosine-5'-triphosphate,3'-diphosphate pyrophosphatase
MPRYAAVDIGSNSVRLLVADVDAGGRLTTLVEDRQVTRLGASVFRTGLVSREATESVCSVLARMAETWRAQSPLAVRIVATAALRDARNRHEFLDSATQATGTPIEIISGQEEARLIHLGVETRWPHPRERILIVDIGGGSAEIIEADQGFMKQAFSRPLGAVRLQTVFLNSDPPRAEDLERLREFIDEKLTGAQQRIAKSGFAHALGTSATASAIVCAVNRIPRPRREAAEHRKVSQAQVRRLYRHLCGLTVEERRKVVGIGPRRAEIILPGAAVLLRVMETFEIPSLAYSTAGVRDGVIRDLAERGVGRERSRLGREQRSLVEQFARRFGVDLKHARAVARFALDLFEALGPLHRLPPEEGRLLEAAAYLRDVGHIINDVSHHKHSQYIIQNSDLAGFTDIERSLVAMLCRYHRKSMPAPRHQDFQALDAEQRRAVLLLAPLLRIADALDRSRDQRVESLRCELLDGQVLLRLKSAKDTGLEQWAVDGAGVHFKQTYDRTLAVQRITA